MSAAPAISKRDRPDGLFGSDRQLGMLLIAPTVAVLLALSIYPLIYLLKVAFQSGPTQTPHWSLANFVRLAGDGFFLSALLHTFVYAVAALTCELLLGLGLAVLVDAPLRGRSAFRLLVLVPMMLPPVVVGVVWRLMLNSDSGALNGALGSLGIDTGKLTWLASPTLAMVSVIAVDVWQWTPFVFLVLLAGLQAIPQEPYEAATVDGASAFQTFRDVTLPLLKPAILVALLLRTMDLLRVFDQIFILTGGGPGFSTETISLYIYRSAFRFFDLGYAAAMSLVLVVLTNLVSISYIKLLGRKEAV